MQSTRSAPRPEKRSSRNWPFRRNWRSWSNVTWASGPKRSTGLLAADEERRDGVEILDEVEWDDSEAAEAAQQASVVRLVNEILEEAIEARASDIHLESQAAGLKVRYRIDGVLQQQPIPPELNRFQNAIISRLKIMSRLNIAEKRVPQDGRIKLKVCGREVDIRVSIIPMLHGEGIVMRIPRQGPAQLFAPRHRNGRGDVRRFPRVDQASARNYPGDGARPARERQLRFTAHSTRSRTRRPKLLRRRTRSSTSSTESTRFRSTQR